MIHPSVIVKNTGLQGKGIFTTTDIKKGEIIWQMDSDVPRFHIDVVRNMPLSDRDRLLKYVMHISEEWYIGMPDGTFTEPGDFVNHSCNPNTWFVKDVALAARWDIKAGEELTYDYATSETFGLEMECQCGSFNCRKIITSDDFINNRDLQKTYGNHVLSHVMRKSLVGLGV